jgi:hypothetical protein
MLKKILILFFIFSNFCHAETQDHCQEDLKIFFEKVLENEQYCVDTIDNGKIYIKSENIIPTKQGILIDLNGFDQVLAPTVSSNSSGCFVQTPSCMWSEVVPVCSSCRKAMWNGVCDNSDCDRYGR